MTAAPAVDPTLDAITAAVALGQEGDAAWARGDLLAIWADLGVAGDPLHRCALAHHLADLYPDPAEALIWDIRAVDAAEALTDHRNAGARREPAGRRLLPEPAPQHR